MFEYKIDMLDGVSRRYINGANGEFIYFAEGEEATAEQQQTHIDWNNAQSLKADKDNIINQLNTLNKTLPDVVEELYTNQGYTMTTDMQAVKTQKDTLKNDYFVLTGEHLPCCIDDTQLNKNDTTELFLRQIIFDLAKRVKTLENGGV